MATVAVVIPWRGGDPQREALLAWLEDRLAARHPDWEVVRGVYDGTPWRKGAAVAAGLLRTSADIVVVHDADVWVGNLAEAVHQVDAGWPWAVPHGPVRRLDEAATTRLLAGAEPDERMRLDRPVYSGVRGGGIVVVPRALACAVPMDPSFAGWSAEDIAWGDALVATAGAPWRGKATLYHGYHPPEPRMSPYIGNPESGELLLRYRRARRRTLEMPDLIAGAHRALAALGVPLASMMSAEPDPS